MTDIASLLSGGDGVQLSIFLTAGYPDVATCGALLDVLAAHPAVAFVELGMPFSDPLADGPTIQRASEVALAGGTKLDDVLAKSDGLRSTAASFQRTATRLRKKLFWANCKTLVFAVVFVAAASAVIFLAACRGVACVSRR